MKTGCVVTTPRRCVLMRCGALAEGVVLLGTPPPEVVRGASPLDLQNLTPLDIRLFRSKFCPTGLIFQSQNGSVRQEDRTYRAKIRGQEAKTFATEPEARQYLDENKTPMDPKN